MPTFTGATGKRTFYFGRSAPPSGIPAWATSAASNAFTSLAPSGAATWNAGAGAVVPAGAYRGTNPIGSILDAYGDPVLDPVTNKIYAIGGGHGDGSCNAVIGFDLATLSYFIECNPTSPSEYPPDFLTVITPGVGYAYPSGAHMHWHKTLAQLPDIADQPYATAISKPIPTHQYGSQAVRYKTGVPREIHFFYAQYKVYNLDTRAWNLDHELGLYWISNKIADRQEVQEAGTGNTINRSLVLQQGTMAVYDDVTDKYFVTLVGGGYRYGFFVWDPATQDCTKVIRSTGFPVIESVPFLKIGRWIYCITSNPALPYTTKNYDRGFRYNIDTEVFEYFSVIGQALSISVDSSQECAPAFYSPNTGKLCQWNHTSSDRQNIYEFDVATFGTEGGAGTTGSPYLWTRTKRALGGTAPGSVSYKYNGVMYVPSYGAAVVFPHSTLPPFAIKV